jgi:hypothetical protein
MKQFQAPSATVAAGKSSAGLFCPIKEERIYRRRQPSKLLAKALITTASSFCYSTFSIIISFQI